MFAKALEVCGKNFGAIKKTFLPWKPVKSIIEYYYKGSDNEDPNDDEPGEQGKRRQFLSVNSTKSLMSAKPTSNSSNNNNNSAAKSNGSTTTTNKDDEGSPGEKRSTSSENAAKLDMFNLFLNGKEIKPLKAKPIIKKEPVEAASSSASNLGSLKFYMDGQLVLKLNAKQQAEAKTQWIESLDTPKILPPVKKVKHKKCPEVDNDKVKSEDTEDCSMDSSDGDSCASSESKSLPSPSGSTGTPRKAKVKLENNCYVPLSSPVLAPAESGLPGSSGSKDIGRLDRRSDTAAESSARLKPKFEFPTMKRGHTHVSHLQKHHVDDNMKQKKLKAHSADMSPISSASSSPKWPLSDGSRDTKYANSNREQKVSRSDRSIEVATCARPPPAHSSSRLNFDYCNIPAPLYHAAPNLLAPVDLTRKSSSNLHNHSSRELKEHKGEGGHGRHLGTKVNDLRITMNSRLEREVADSDK